MCSGRRWSISFSHLRASAIPAERSSPWGLHSNHAGNNFYISPLILILLFILTRKHCVTVTRQRKSPSEVPYSHYRLSEKEAVSTYQFHACQRTSKAFPFFGLFWVLAGSPPPRSVILNTIPMVLFLSFSLGFSEFLLSPNMTRNCSTAPASNSSQEPRI